MENKQLWREKRAELGGAAREADAEISQVWDLMVVLWCLRQLHSFPFAPKTCQTSWWIWPMRLQGFSAAKNTSVYYAVKNPGFIGGKNNLKSITLCKKDAAEWVQGNNAAWRRLAEVMSHSWFMLLFLRGAKPRKWKSCIYKKQRVFLRN